MSKLPARRIRRSRETLTKEFDQAGSKFGSAVFEINRMDSIWTVSLPRIKAREGMENVRMKNFNFRDEVVREAGRRGGICLASSKVELVAKV